jgi:hypothetical protein
MRDASDYSPIRPELVAKKLELLRNSEQLRISAEMRAQPRLEEVLWFLAFVSRNENYPGGLRKFSSDLIAQSADLIGTAIMQAHGAPPYPAPLHEQIHSEIPNEHRWGVRGGSLRDFLPDPEEATEDLESAEQFAETQARREREQRREALQEREFADVMREMMAGGIIGHCTKAAERGLADYLVNLCERPDVQFTRTGNYISGERAPWYFVRVSDAILRFIDRRQDEIAPTIAETAVSREIFKWLGKARSTGRSIIISGNSRFGKTEAVRAWAAMNPSRARIVETPSSGGEGELLRAVAKALGIGVDGRQRGYALHAQIEYILRQFRPVLIFEEASFLYPANFSKNTMPARLNWVRRTVMDAGCPCAFVWTPQTHRDARNRFLKATNFAIEQFDGRILKTVNLPAEIPSEDLLAIARFHFRGLPDDYCEYVVSKAAATERNYCSDVSNIAALAYSNAEDAGRKKPNFEDIKAAIADVLPTASELSAAPSERLTRSRSALPLQTPCKPRETRPPGIPAEDESAVVEHEEFFPVSRIEAAAAHLA